MVAEHVRYEFCLVVLQSNVTLQYSRETTIVVVTQGINHVKLLGHTANRDVQNLSIQEKTRHSSCYSALLVSSFTTCPRTTALTWPEPVIWEQLTETSDLEQQYESIL